MATPRATAQKLCNSSELELYSASLRGAIESLNERQLRAKVSRARTLRDKQADLLRRQTMALQSRPEAGRAAAQAANQRTERKRQLFDEVLLRLEARLARLDAGAGGTQSKPARTQPTTERARVAAAPPKKSAVKRAAAKAATRVAAKPAAGSAKPAAPAKKSAAAKSAGATAAAPSSARGPARKAAAGAAPKAARGTPLSAVVQVRGKIIGAHARAAQARNDAKRGRR